MKVFKEQQRFTQLWIIVLLILSTAVPLLIFLSSYANNEVSMTSLEFMFFISFLILLPFLIFLFKLTTRIDDYGIHYKFSPLHLKYRTITWNEISKAFVRRYDAISEYGGWGLKGGFFWRKSKGIAINVSGDIGIQLELKNGKKILIGTNQEEKAKQVLRTYSSKI